MKIYKSKVVQELEVFYGELLYEIGQFSTIRDHMSALASRMWEGVRAENEAVFIEISNYHWDHLGKSPKVLAGTNLSEESCKQTIANEFGFRRWSEVQHLDFPYNYKFESTVNLFLEGNFVELKAAINEQEELLNHKSDYGHKATLLHYAASNGVELWRQKVPLNISEMVAFLIEKGINTKAKMKVYNGEYKAAELLLSSAHPRDAGVLKALRKNFNI